MNMAMHLNILKRDHGNLDSRKHGQGIRAFIEKILEGHDVINIDFSGVTVITSGLADEAFGKLFYDMGPVHFMNRIRIINDSQTIRGLIDRAIEQRIVSYRNMNNGGGCHVEGC